MVRGVSALGRYSGLVTTSTWTSIEEDAGDRLAGAEKAPGTLGLGQVLRVGGVWMMLVEE